MKKIVVVQVGMMHDHAAACLKTLLKQPDLFDFRGICPITEKGKQKAEKYIAATYKDVLIPVLSLQDVLAIKDLDAVCIETEEELATEYALLFAEKGIAIYMDKPGSASPYAFRKLISLVKEKDIAFQMGYMYRFNPLYQKALAMKENGELGDIFGVEVHMSVHHSVEKRQWLAKHKGGMMYYLGCHDIDIIYRLMGEPAEVIPMNTATKADGVISEDLGFCVFRYPHCIAFIKTCAAEYNGFDRRQLVITGTRGTFEIRPFETYVGATNGKQLSHAHVTTVKNEGKNIRLPCGEDIVSEPFDRYESMMAHFASQVRGERDKIYTPDYELALFELVMRAVGISPN